MIYLDSSALLKLLVQEAESDALERWLVESVGLPTISSQLAVVEVSRACRRLDPALLPQARSLLGQLDLLPLSASVVQRATELDGPGLRSLDALHLASALEVGGELHALVAYDHRLVEAAARTGLTTRQPGA